MGSGEGNLQVSFPTPHSLFPTPRLSGSGIAARDRRQDRFQNRFLVRGLAGLGFGPRRRAVVVNRQSGDDAANLNRVERFAREQLLSQTVQGVAVLDDEDRKSTRLNSSHLGISYAVFCLKKKN